LASIETECPDLQEVMVVDDASSDNTWAVAAAMGARVVSSALLPSGWTGKTWALHQGVTASSGELLLFLDADTFFATGGLSALIASYHQESRATQAAHGIALSVLPFHIMQKPYEQLSLFFNLLMAIGAGGFGMFGRGRLFGQFLLISRELYQRSDGHEAVRGTILENFAFAEHVRVAGGSCITMGGRGTLHVRMFPHGFRQLTEGWTKAFADGAAGSDPLILVVSIIWLTTLCGTFLTLMIEPSAIFAALYACFSLQLIWMTQPIGNFRWFTCFLYPIALVFYFVIFGQSLYLRTFKQQVAWSGRRV